MLAAFHKCVVCSGGPEGYKFRGIQLECAAIDKLVSPGSLEAQKLFLGS